MTVPSSKGRSKDDNDEEDTPMLLVVSTHRILIGRGGASLPLFDVDLPYGLETSIMTCCASTSTRGLSQYTGTDDLNDFINMTKKSIGCDDAHNKSGSIASPFAGSSTSTDQRMSKQMNGVSLNGSDVSNVTIRDSGVTNNNTTVSLSLRKWAKLVLPLEALSLLHDELCVVVLPTEWALMTSKNSTSCTGNGTSSVVSATMSKRDLKEMVASLVFEGLECSKAVFVASAVATGYALGVGLSDDDMDFPIGKTVVNSIIRDSGDSRNAMDVAAYHHARRNPKRLIVLEVNGASVTVSHVSNGSVQRYLSASMGSPSINMKCAQTTAADQQHPHSDLYWCPLTALKRKLSRAIYDAQEALRRVINANGPLSSFPLVSRMNTSLNRCLQSTGTLSCDAAQSILTSFLCELDEFAHHVKIDIDKMTESEIMRDNVTPHPSVDNGDAKHIMESLMDNKEDNTNTYLTILECAYSTLQNVKDIVTTYTDLHEKLLSTTKRSSDIDGVSKRQRSSGMSATNGLCHILVDMLEQKLANDLNDDDDGSSSCSEDNTETNEISSERCKKRRFTTLLIIAGEVAALPCLQRAIGSALTDPTHPCYVRPSLTYNISRSLKDVFTPSGGDGKRFEGNYNNINTEHCCTVWDRFLISSTAPSIGIQLHSSADKEGMCTSIEAQTPPVHVQSISLHSFTGASLLATITDKELFRGVLTREEYNSKGREAIHWKVCC